MNIEDLILQQGALECTPELKEAADVCWKHAQCYGKYWVFSMAVTYGIILGKQMDRARRKAGGSNGTKC